MDIAKPPFKEAIAKCVQDTIDNIVVIPALLISASHTKENIVVYMERSRESPFELQGIN